MKRLLLSWLLAATCLTAAMAQTTTSSQDPDEKYTQGLLTPGTEAPDFTLLPPTKGKAAQKLSDYRQHTKKGKAKGGQYVVLDFWATWCPDCRREIPTVKDINKKYGDKVKVIGVSFDTDRETLKTFNEKNGIGWTMYSEYKKWKETEISRRYNIKWLPTMYLISPEGKVVYTTVIADRMLKKLDELSAAGKF